jgi:hypothetical protein
MLHDQSKEIIMNAAFSLTPHQIHQIAAPAVAGLWWSTDLDLNIKDIQSIERSSFLSGGSYL